jgi:hypothetical protein
MNKEEQVLEIMLDSLKEISEEYSEFDFNQCNDSMVLFGAGATIDSLTLVTLIVELESKISECFSLDISLTDDRAMTREISPFDTFGSLKSYIVELINEN